MYLENITVQGRKCSFNHTLENSRILSSSLCTTIPSGGGAKRVDVNLCRETYDFVVAGNTTAHIDSFLTDLKREKNLTFTFRDTAFTVQNWQFVCSNLINRTLMEDFVCESVGEFVQVNERTNKTAIEELRTSLSQNVSLSFDLTSFYVENYEKACRIEPQARETAKRVGIFFLFVILFGLMVMVARRNNKMKEFVFMELVGDTLKSGQKSLKKLFKKHL